MHIPDLAGINASYFNVHSRDCILFNGHNRAGQIALTRNSFPSSNNTVNPHYNVYKCDEPLE